MGFDVMQQNLTVMMYHYVRDAEPSGIPGLPIAEFEAQLDTFVREYEMVTWEEVRAALVNGTTLPARACLLTFDDGLIDHYVTVFPRLAQRNMGGLFFALARENQNILPLPFKLHYLIACLGLERLRDEIWQRLDHSQRDIHATAEARYRLRWRSDEDILKAIWQRELEHAIDPIASELLREHVGAEAELARGLFLSDAQVREMRAGGMSFGGHSRTHPWLDYVDQARRQDEIRASRELLEQIQEAPFAFAYPYGGLAEDAPDLLRANAFAAAFTTKPHREQSDAFYIGRFDGQEWSH